MRYIVPGRDHMGSQKVRHPRIFPYPELMDCGGTYTAQRRGLNRSDYHHAIGAGKRIGTSTDQPDVPVRGGLGERIPGHTEPLQRTPPCSTTALFKSLNGIHASWCSHLTSSLPESARLWIAEVPEGFGEENLVGLRCFQAVQRVSSTGGVPFQNG